MHRRDFLTAAGAAAVAPALTSAAPTAPGTASAQPDPAKGRLKQSVCRWCFSGIPLDELCRQTAAIGLKSVELLGPDEWAEPARHGLVCAVATNVSANPIGKGLNRVENHDAIVSQLEARLPEVAKAGIPNQIVFSGNRKGLPDDQGLANCVTGLKRIVPLAEKAGVTIIMELLNSRRDHGDYMCDRTAWGVELVKRVGSDRFKLLYDIYHMQIMEGDVIATITENAKFIGHYHTAGVPGRRDLDATQELNYPAICRAIADTGFAGYFGQEFMPRDGKNAIAALRSAALTCTV